MPEQVTTWGTAVQTSLTQALALLLSAVPKIMAFVLLLAIGWAVASLVAHAVDAILRRVRFNDMAHRSGFAGFIDSTGVEVDAVDFIALISKWFIRLIALVVAFDALGLSAVSGVLRQLLLWLPNLVVALVVLVLGGLAAGVLGGLVRAGAASAELGRPDLLRTIARYSVWAFAIIVAVNQIGIASDLVNTLFTAVVAGLALALGLAFGLGGRDTAAEIMREFSERVRGASHKLGRSPTRTRERGGMDARREH
jgi:hypothetical protein